MVDITPSEALDRTKFATGEGKSNKPGTRQIGVMVTEDHFNIVKDEAIRQNVSMGEIVRQCIELVLIVS